VKWRLLLLIGLTLLAIGADGQMRLSVTVRPRIVLMGGTVRVECRVPRLSQYQWVIYGILGPDFTTSSTRQLPGPVVYELLTTLPRSACGTHYAFCDVVQHDQLGVVRAPVMPLLVRGLGCPDEEPEAPRVLP
jgi:hypothetical protein